jgi:hypothetical protein
MHEALPCPPLRTDLGRADCARPEVRRADFPKPGQIAWQSILAWTWRSRGLGA